MAFPPVIESLGHASDERSVTRALAFHLEALTPGSSTTPSIFPLSRHMEAMPSSVSIRSRFHPPHSPSLRPTHGAPVGHPHRVGRYLEPFPLANEGRRALTAATGAVLTDPFFPTPAAPLLQSVPMRRQGRRSTSQPVQPPAFWLRLLGGFPTGPMGSSQEAPAGQRRPPPPPLFLPPLPGPAG